MANDYCKCVQNVTFTCPAQVLDTHLGDTVHHHSEQTTNLPIPKNWPAWCAPSDYIPEATIPSTAAVKATKSKALVKTRVKKLITTHCPMDQTIESRLRSGFLNKNLYL